VRYVDVWVIVSSHDVVYHPSRLLDSTPEHLHCVVPGVKKVWIDGDGQCALRAVAVGLWPSLGNGEDDERVADVRRDLLGELQRWSAGKWMNVVPGRCRAETESDGADCSEASQRYCALVSTASRSGASGSVLTAFPVLPFCCQIFHISLEVFGHVRPAAALQD
jgi:hypothetical protein